MADKKSTVDNWKKKKWYDVSADTTFDEKKIGETVTINPKNLIGRIVKKGLNSPFLIEYYILLSKCIFIWSIELCD